MFSKIRLDFLAGNVVRSLQRADRRVRYLRNVFIPEVFKITEREDEALFVRQSGKAFHQRPLGFSAVKIRVIAYTAFIGRRYIPEHQRRTHLFLSQEIQRFVRGYPPQPGEQPRITPERRQGLPYLDKNLLEEIVRIFMGIHERAHVPIEPLAIVPDYGAESLLTAPLFIEGYDFLVVHNPAI